MYANTVWFQKTLDLGKDRQGGYDREREREILMFREMGTQFGLMSENLFQTHILTVMVREKNGADRGNGEKRKRGAGVNKRP